MLQKILSGILKTTEGDFAVPSQNPPQTPKAQQNVDPWAIGAVIEGRFRLEKKLGRGNFGTVFAARHLSLDRPVAIKRLHSQFFDRDQLLTRLRHEGTSTCQIEHPNAVRVLDFSVASTGEPYLVMELLRGRNLEQELAASPDGRLDPRRVVEILIPVCDLLVEIHRLGMLHLDLKPANIFLHRRRQQEVVKVLDFGIARMVSPMDEGPSSNPEIQTASFEGTPPYAAPERLMGEPFGPKADIYSFGVVLYQMLTGLLPYRDAKSPIHLITLCVNGKYTPAIELLADIPPELNSLCDDAMVPQPRDRPNAQQLLERLKALA